MAAVADVLRAGLTVPERNLLVLVSKHGIEEAARMLKRRPAVVADEFERVKGKAAAAAAASRVSAPQDRRSPHGATCSCGIQFIRRPHDNGRCPACRELGDEPERPREAPARVLPPLREVPRRRRRRRASLVSPGEGDTLPEVGGGEHRSGGDPSQSPPTFTSPDHGGIVDGTTRAKEASVRRESGARLAEAMAVLRDCGPMRQADLRAALGAPSSVMAVMVPQLRAAGVVFGERVAQSPMLSFPEDGVRLGGVGPTPKDVEPVRTDGSGGAPEPALDPPPKWPTPEEAGMVPAEPEVVVVNGVLPEELRLRYLEVLLRALEADDPPDGLMLARFERVAGLRD